MMPGETSPQERFAYVCKHFGAQIKIILKDCMNTQVNIGYHFLHLIHFLLCTEANHGLRKFLVDLSSDRRHQRRIIDTYLKLIGITVMGERRSQGWCRNKDPSDK